MNLLEGAGIFIYPLSLCSFLAVFIMLERWFALRRSSVFPCYIDDSLNMNELERVEPDDLSVAGRVMLFSVENGADSSSIKAFARFEIAKMERGLFLLDIIVAAAPLIGLLGTVVGLIKVFSTITPGTGLPDPSSFVQGISLALTTTMLGLLIAIPAIAGNSYLSRRIEIFAAKLDLLIEKLTENSAK